MTLIVLGVIVAVPVALAYVAAPTRPPVKEFLRAAGIGFLEFHHVGLVVDLKRVPIPGLGGVAGAGFSVTIALAFLTATFIGLALLYLGGRAVGRRAGGPALVRGIQGIKVAIPYAVVIFGLSFLLRFKVGGGTNQVQVGPAASVHPSHLAAFLWPLVLGAIMGFFGGLGSSSESFFGREVWGRRARGAVSGGLRMLSLGLLLSFVGLLVLGAIHPDITRAYFRSVFQPGPEQGAAVVFVHSLLIPNMAAWVLFPSMGACVGATGGPVSACVLSWSHFPTRVGPAPAPSPGLGANPFNFIPNFGSPPPIYFLFLLVPLIAVILGGIRAAKRSEAATRGEAIGVGAAAGVVFAALALGLAVLADITFKLGGRISFFAANFTARVGPDLVVGTLLALVWGVIGGALGGLIHGRALAAAPPAAGEVWQPAAAWEPTAPAPPVPPIEHPPAGPPPAAPPAEPQPPPAAPGEPPASEPPPGHVPPG